MNLQEYKSIIANHNPEFKLFQEKFFPIVMQMEGGGKLHNVKGDNGGWTIWGIAYNFWNKLFSNFDDFKDTTRDEAAHIAFVEFYLKIHADKIPYDSKLFYFDTAYNMGTNRAIKMMQDCAGVVADGMIGSKTIAAMKNVKKECLREKRESYYNYLGSKSKYSKFLKGWLNRSRTIANFKY